MARREIMGLCAAAAAAAALCAPLESLAQTSPVRARRTEPVVTRTEFDPRRPPPDMPKLTPPEAGVCNTEFALEIGVGYSIEVVSPTAVKVIVDELDLVTSLTLSIFVERGAPERLRAHEEGHRAIGEYYYQNADRAAEEAGRALIGMAFDGFGSSRAEAEQDGYRKINAALEDAYMSRTRVRALAANNRFDAITEHGLNSIPVPDAVAMAVSSDPEP